MHNEWIVRPRDREHMADILYKLKDDIKFIELCDWHKLHNYDIEKVGDIIMEDNYIIMESENTPTLIFKGNDAKRIATKYRDQGKIALIYLPLIMEEGNAIYVDPKTDIGHIRILDEYGVVVKKINARFYSGDILITDPPYKFRISKRTPRVGFEPTSP